jgi:hypothetical protein
VSLRPLHVELPWTCIKTSSILEADWLATRTNLPLLLAEVLAGHTCRCCSVGHVSNLAKPNNNPLSNLPGHPDSWAPAHSCTDPTSIWCYVDVIHPTVPSSSHNLLWLDVHIIHYLPCLQTGTPSCLPKLFRIAAVLLWLDALSFPPRHPFCRCIGPPIRSGILLRPPLASASLLISSALRVYLRMPKRQLGLATRWI